jgi:hypothetical protein
MSCIRGEGPRCKWEIHPKTCKVVRGGPSGADLDICRILGSFRVSTNSIGVDLQ